MSCETFEENICGVQYVTTQWPATKQMVIKFKLIKMFGEAIFTIVESMNVKGKDKDAAQLAALKSALSTVFETSSPEELAGLITEILTLNNATKRDGTRISTTNYDQLYSGGDMKENYMALLFVIKSNYSAFFKGQKASDFLAKVEAQL